LPPVPAGRERESSLPGAKPARGADEAYAADRGDRVIPSRVTRPRAKAYTG